MDAQSDHARLAENIAFMRLLTEVPNLPTRRTPSTRVPVESDEGRCLPLWAERIVVRLLAYLSGIKDDNTKITAVCVRESKSGKSIKVLVAANAKGSGVYSPYLDRVKRGFEEILSILAGASSVPSAVLEEQVFRVVVSMCHDRIVSRVRFDLDDIKDPARKDKATARKRIQQSLDGALRLSNSKSVEEFCSSLELLLEQLDKGQLQYDKSKRLEPEQLATIIAAFEWLKRVPNFEAILLDSLGAIHPPVELSMRRSVLDTTRKMCHYRYLAIKLVKMAKRYRPLRHATVRLVLLPEEAYRRFNWPTEARLAAVLERIAAHSGNPCSLRQLCQYVRRNQQLSELEGDFDKYLTQSSGEARVHAEVQLVSFLQEDSTAIMPRVIASNKSACFLCDMFFQRHGMFMVPCSHGKLYPRWRLPMTFSQTVIDSLNVELEGVILSLLKALDEGPLMRSAYPVESTISSNMETITTCLTRSGGSESSGDDEPTTGNTTPLARSVVIDKGKGKEMAPLVQSVPRESSRQLNVAAASTHFLEVRAEEGQKSGCPARTVQEESPGSPQDDDKAIDPGKSVQDRSSTQAREADKSRLAKNDEPRVSSGSTVNPEANAYSKTQEAQPSGIEQAPEISRGPARHMRAQDEHLHVQSKIEEDQKDPVEKPWKTAGTGNPVRCYKFRNYRLQIEYQASTRSNGNARLLAHRKRDLPLNKVARCCEQRTYDLGEVGRLEQTVQWCRVCNILRLKIGERVAAIELSPFEI